MATLFSILLAALAAVPALFISGTGLGVPVPLATAAFGLAIVGASFAMAWGAEAAEHDIPRALALTVIALLAVFPEYAVDIVFAFKAGANPAFAPYAAANMTGSNRLLLGLGWPTVAILAWLVTGQRRLRLTRDALLPLLFLSVATIYSFVIPLKASIGLVDTLVLFALFGIYAVLAMREDTEQPDLVGPAAAIGSLRAGRRRLVVLGLFAFAGYVIGTSAAPFADGLVRTGQALGIDEFLLVQWLAPIASEAPEFLVAGMLALRGKSSAAIALLLSSKLNQWTLLVGSLPLAYAVGAASVSAAHPALGMLWPSLPLDSRQLEEVCLTAAQSLFGVAILANLALELGDAFLLVGLFLAQLILGALLRTTLHNAPEANLELVVFSVVYLILSLLFAYRARRSLGSLWRLRRGLLSRQEDNDEDVHTPAGRAGRVA